MTGTSSIIRANSRDLPIADDSVDLVVTSPPYFALRSYQDGGEHYAGQIGDEPTPAEFVESLLEVTRECVRVLKPSGSLWVNLGDKYAGGGGQWDKDERPDPHKRRAASGKIASGGKTFGLRPKSLIGIPWRYALRCIDDLGLILRAEVIWSKPNGLPESVTDRVRRSHEQWFHFTLQPRYFSAVDEIREEHAPQSIARTGRNRFAPDLSQDGVGSPNTLNPADMCNPLGKLPGSVWTVPTQPLRVPDHLGVDHFAAFPMEWPRRIIQGWAPTRGVCVECGEGRRPVAEQHRTSNDALRPAYGAGNHGTGGSTLGPRGVVAHITGEACACPEPTAPTRPAVILDPFGGTGTTALLAKALGCHGISVDMSADYCRLAQWRTNDEGELARALQVEKPKPQVEGQASLLDLIDQEAIA